DIDIATEAPEFRAWRWAEPAELPDLIVPFKRRMYEQLVAEFGHLATGLRDE
ncbi:MAG: RNA pyrophosphohydrolase, partial [Proteobacteria bacterium]|nr:RNA pyrophosphohydrolase [Pseudomonadota bacterium]